MSSTKSVLLITEDQNSAFSKKVMNAVSLSKVNLVVEPPTFKSFSKVLHGNIGCVVLDHDELGNIADYYFRAIRMFHSCTPVLMAFSKKIIVEQLFSQAKDRDISAEDLAKLMVDAMDFDEEAKTSLNLSYVFEKDIALQRLAEIFAKSIEFDKELTAARNEFDRLFEERGIGKMVGEDLTKAIDDLRHEVYSSPVFAHLRAQMEKKRNETQVETEKVLH